MVCFSSSPPTLSQGHSTLSQTKVSPPNLFTLQTSSLKTSSLTTPTSAPAAAFRASPLGKAGACAARDRRGGGRSAAKVELEADVVDTLMYRVEGEGEVYVDVVVMTLYLFF